MEAGPGVAPGFSAYETEEALRLPTRGVWRKRWVLPPQRPLPRAARLATGCGQLAIRVSSVAEPGGLAPPRPWGRLASNELGVLLPDGSVKVGGSGGNRTPGPWRGPRVQAGSARHLPSLPWRREGESHPQGPARGLPAFEAGGPAHVPIPPGVPAAGVAPAFPPYERGGLRLADAGEALEPMAGVEPALRSYRDRGLPLSDTGRAASRVEGWWARPGSHRVLQRVGLAVCG